MNYLLEEFEEEDKKMKNKKEPCREHYFGMGLSKKPCKKCGYSSDFEWKKAREDKIEYLKNNHPSGSKTNMRDWRTETLEDDYSGFYKSLEKKYKKLNWERKMQYTKIGLMILGLIMFGIFLMK